jgi:predicted membrane protein
MNKNFFTGLEEVASRLISLVITSAFFLVYISAKTNQEILVNWTHLLLILSIFWLVYELLGYLFFMIFNYFGNQTDKPLQTDIKTTVQSQEDENFKP